MRVTMKVSLGASLEPAPLPLASQTLGALSGLDAKYYQVTFSPMQVSTLYVSRINITLTGINGHCELYASTRVRQPAHDAAEYSSVSMNPVNKVQVDVSATPDLTNFTLYIGVFAPIGQATFSLRVDADYVNLYPQSTGQGQAGPSSQD
jgi:hypothetical protein